MSTRMDSNDMPTLVRSAKKFVIRRKPKLEDKLQKLPSVLREQIGAMAGALTKETLRNAKKRLQSIDATFLTMDSKKVSPKDLLQWIATCLSRESQGKLQTVKYINHIEDGLVLSEIADTTAAEIRVYGEYDVDFDWEGAGSSSEFNELFRMLGLECQLDVHNHHYMRLDSEEAKKDGFVGLMKDLIADKAERIDEFDEYVMRANPDLENPRAVSSHELYFPLLELALGGQPKEDASTLTRFLASLKS